MFDAKAHSHFHVLGLRHIRKTCQHAVYSCSSITLVIQVAPSWKKKLSVYIGVAAIVLVTVVLILLSFLFSYDLKLVHKG